MPLFGKKKPEDMKQMDLFEHGSKAYSEQNWEEASEYLRILVNKTPNFKQGREMLIMSLIQEQKADEALEHCEFLLKRDPNNPMYYVQRGSCYQIQENTDAAIKELAHSLELHEDAKIRGMFLYLKTPNIPLVNLAALDNSGASLLARALSSADLSFIPELEETSKQMAELGDKMQDDIMAAKEPEAFMKQIAETCIERGIYADVNDLLKKYGNIGEVNNQLQILESKSGIVGRFAEFYHLNFVHFEKK
ncbi:MAG: hypothetical protein ACFFDQ_13265 [Candidatus Thorarchaeota archaeon]